MAITAKDVQALREMTGVGMMDCKKALTEAEGDMDKAVEILREKGLAASQKKAGRIAAEGMAYAAVIDGVGVVVEVNAETDFVGKNEKFVDFVKGVAAVVAKEKPADLDALMALPFGNGRTVQEEQQEMVLVIGENIKVRRFAFYTDGVSVAYVHAGGKIGVLVNMETSLSAEQVEAVGKDVAMQIAALNPRFWDKSQVDQATLDEEKKIMLVQMANDPKMASKPDKVKEGIILQGELPAPAGVREGQLHGRGQVYRDLRQVPGRHHRLQGRRPLREGRGHREEAGELCGRDRQAAGQVIAKTHRGPDAVCPALFHARCSPAPAGRRAAP